MLDEVLDGLRQSQKSLPSKFFYDEKGSKIFNEITQLKEYYPTRTERRILDRNITDIGRHLGDKVALFEPGSGSSEKTMVLLTRLPEIKYYIPIDISGDYIFKVAEKLKRQFEGIEVVPVQADYTRPFELPEVNDDVRNIVFFPGSTIGNFNLQTVHRFLNVVANIAGSNGGFLIGVDLKKEIPLLEAAYNDAKGVTAAFNKNILHHINRKTGANFDVDKFRHKATWNEKKGRIEMHLIADKDHTVQLNGEAVHFSMGESIHTENSHKYTLDEFEEMVSPWFEVKQVWLDENRWFSVQYLEPVG
ncbi:MAG: L-histidine N(alpha)-methyltransferase [Balneolaceae bacterium]|nr:L-histidine N(alpha)-methyltransferase [Balneolaceae bacterium]